MLLGVAASMGFQVFRGDVKAVKAAFLQGDLGEEDRGVLAETVKELRDAMRLEHHQCIKLKKAVYGLVNAPRRWWSRVRKDMEKLGWVESSTEPCLWYLRDKSDKLCGLAVAHVDDFMIAVDNTSKFATDALQRLHQAYEWGSWESQDFVQCGTRIRQEYDGRTKTWGRFHLNMVDYAQELKEIDIPTQRRKDI
eukprot:1049458-Pyramimonas_sp.AAC.1